MTFPKRLAATKLQPAQLCQGMHGQRLAVDVSALSMALGEAEQRGLQECPRWCLVAQDFEGLTSQKVPRGLEVDQVVIIGGLSLTSGVVGCTT